MPDTPGGYGGTSSEGGASNNVRGSECEQTIFRALNILGLVEDVDFVHTKNIPYSDHHDSDSIKEDFIFPDEANPLTLLSVTQSHPSRKGHSNENKTHQHIGETWLFKTHNQHIRHITFLCGNPNTWLNYVPHTIALFQDYTIFDWNPDGSKKSELDIAGELQMALGSKLRNAEFWAQERRFRLQNEGVSGATKKPDRSNLTSSTDQNIPKKSFRTEFFVNVIQPLMGVNSISSVDNRILRFMLENSGRSAIKSFLVNKLGYYDSDVDKKTDPNGIQHPVTLRQIAEEHGIDWTNKKDFLKKILSREDIDFWTYGRLWDFLSNARREDPNDPDSAYRIWKERSLHNPTEAAFDLLLQDNGFDFVSEINATEQREMYVHPNLLYEHHHWVPEVGPGAKKTHRRTDFKLVTSTGVNVYVECKSSGGGSGVSENKHLTDRSREQVARSVIHRCSYDSNTNKLVSGAKNFLWYYILDNNWHYPKTWPCKYVNNLEMSGVDGYYAASDLVDKDFEPNPNFPLLDVLEALVM